MAKPSIKELLASCARWTGSHKGIWYELSWHGQSDFRPEGVWCYYLLLTSEQFRPEDWDKLRLKSEDKKLYDSWHRHFDYDSFPDLAAHGGWTFGEMSRYLARDGIEHERIKVGCDYGHLWDEESGFWQGKDAVEADAMHSIDLLCDMFPHRKLRCAYSGTYDDPEQFYTARNGALVHKSKLNKLAQEGAINWLPVDADPEAVLRGDAS